MFSTASLPYVLRWSEFVDIDDADDFARAEAIAAALRPTGKPPSTQDNLPLTEPWRDAGAS
jgi:hypothetical protein